VTNAPMPTTILIDTVRTLDEVFIQIAEGVGPALPVDEVVEELWAMLALGSIRLTVDANRLRVDPLPPVRTKGRPRRGQAGTKPSEQMRLARAHRQIIEARQRVLEGEA
jgi:hypothetical protein